MAVSKKAKAIYNFIFEGFETSCANFISNHIERKYLKKYSAKEVIPESFKIEYKKYWSKYLNGKELKEGMKFAWYYASQNRILDARYIPNTLYYTKIDQYFNNRKLGWGFNDKNYYSKIFKGIKQPETIIRKIGEQVLDKDYNIIDNCDAFEMIMLEDEVICKPTLETGSGRDIRFLENKR